MKKLILVIPFVFFTCSEPRESKIEIFTDSSLGTDSISVLDKAEAALQHTEGLEEEIQETYKTKETLLKENKQLKKEIKTMKDSLVEMKNKLPKKQNFFQKVFNIVPDSVEVITIDTIK